MGNAIYASRTRETIIMPEVRADIIALQRHPALDRTCFYMYIKCFLEGSKAQSYS